ncbi:SLC13 family permease [uncultured Roseibium sp.]|uniref:SLC13 family permease n=1 Tax=uncultured Roseibium sp. TaxID=1936171 RepID=UPI002603C807|nr:SLC13 family permease [uncultured Roseibium sp.]
MPDRAAAIRRARMPAVIDPLLGKLIGIAPNTAIAILIASVLAGFVFLAPHGMPQQAAAAFLLTGLAIVGWTLTPIPDSVVAVFAAVGLVLTGAFPEERFYQALGTEIVWLLIAAFVIAAAIKSSGLTQWLAFAVTKRFSSVSGLFHGLTFVITATAFLVPSTSGRAALLVPVFVSLLPAMPTGNLRRALALLFPSAILLSAGGSLIGAGAHFVAVETIRTSTGNIISFFEWIMLAFPVALLSAHGATLLILQLFVPANERRTRLSTSDDAPSGSFSTKQKRLLFVLSAMVLAWSTTGWHGLGTAVIACLGAALVVTPLLTEEKPKELFRNVETELLVFLASTLVIAQAVVSTGKSKWLADKLLFILPADVLHNRELTILFVVLVSVAAHLVINSRSARAAVLIPALALPLAEFDHDTATLILVTVLGTGFCQTMVASAKPIAIFRSVGENHFEQSDLMRLALALLPLKVAVIAVFAIFVWPIQMPVLSERNPIVQHQGLHADPFEVTSLAAHDSVRPQPMEGALCSAHHLEVLMLGTIRDETMWAAGWWHVWNRLRQTGYPVEKSAVKEIYRKKDMVYLRDHSVAIAEINLRSERVREAASLCSGALQESGPAGTTIPLVPRKKP